MRGFRKYLPLLLTLVFGVAIQISATAAGKSFYLTQLTMASYYAVVVIGLCLLMGYAGQISIGHAGFFAIGGYVSARLTTLNLVAHQEHVVVRLLGGLRLLAERETIYGESLLYVSPWLACGGALLATVVVAWLIGMPVLRLRGHYLAMATLGFGLIVQKIAVASRFLGGADGLSGVPPFELVPGLVIQSAYATDERIRNFYIAWGLVLVSLILAVNLIHSRVGRALRAIHGAPEAAEAMGVNISRYKVMTFVISAGMAAVAGVFLTHFNGGIDPSEASIMKSVRYVALVAVGGMANLWGAVVMALVLTFLSLRGYFGWYDDAVFGAILIVIMLFAPNGLINRQVVRGVTQRVRSLCNRCRSGDAPSSGDA